MRNAKEELQSILERNESVIKCAYITTERNSYWDDDDDYIQSKPILLKEGHTQEEYKEFLQKLNFEDDAGYGGQELYGTVWLMEEGTWLERGEYYGSEWWDYKKCPGVIDELKA